MRVTAFTYVDEGQILTSAGSAAGLDLCLHLVRRDYGPAIANQVARHLVIPPHRDGGQAQYVEKPVEQAASNSFAVLMDRLRKRLAEHVHCRHGRIAASAMDWVTRMRLDQAREFLESTRLSIDIIAQRTGMGTAMTLRHHFRRKVGVSEPLGRLINHEGVLRTLAIELAIGELAFSKLINHVDSDLRR
jgi:AraC family transcriptional activator FtrA